MVAYSLIDCSSGYFSIGIYTNLDNLYLALKTLFHDCLKVGFSQKEIKGFYKVKKVYLDAEPLKVHEFSRYGIDVEIDWNKIF